MIRDYRLGEALVEFVNVDPDAIYATYDENSKIVAIFCYMRPRLNIVTGWTVQECQHQIMGICNRIDNEISEELLGK